MANESTGDTERMSKKTYSVPAEHIEPDIERMLTVALVEPPGPFAGYIKPEELQKFHDEPGVIELLIGLGKLNEGQDWLIQQSLFSNRQRRRLEAELIRLRKEIAEERRARQESERAMEEKSKVDIRDWIKRALIWVLLLGLGALFGGKVLFAK